MFTPKFTLTPAIAKAWMKIEACRQAIVRLPLTVPMLDSLRKTGPDALRFKLGDVWPWRASAGKRAFLVTYRGH